MYINKKQYLITIFWFIVLGVLILPNDAWAYIGPGAGFALVSSLFTLFISFLMAFVSLLTFPVRFLIRSFRNRQYTRNAKVKRVVVVGLDGLDYDLCNDFMEKGCLPNFSKLKENGGYSKFQTTYPSISPVAWSTFATGVNPGKHNIYDFLMRNPKTYLPELSSSKVVASEKILKLGKYEIPLGKAKVQFLRKSQSFWTILGKYGIFSHIIRVPITFPPEKFHGAQLSAMCTPDLRGTQGTFTYYTNTEEKKEFKATGGNHQFLEQKNSHYESRLIGPESVFTRDHKPVEIPFRLKVNSDQKSVTMTLGGENHALNLEKFSPYLSVQFKLGPGVSAWGICQFYLKNIDPEIQLYMSPVQIDPEKPALPISNPKFFSTYLAKLFGKYNTLGLSEDTWALNESVLDDQAFLKQVYQIHEEREKQFFHALKKTKQGVCACVFDGTDRIQHMFFRYLIDDHPAPKVDDPLCQNAILNIYKRADEMIGRVLEEIDEDTVLFVISDHGFKSFQRGINLNSWLHQNGYLVLKNDDFDADYFRNVNWEKTRAYAVGLAGIYLNIKGRERKGIVNPGEEAKALRQELIQKMSGLKDNEKKTIGIRRMIDKYEVLSGPYLDNAPDLIAGYEVGYRISWDGAIGKTTQTVFEDNIKAWSGDHGIDPERVPGVIFSNKTLKSESVGLVDMAPTILDLFGVPAPSHMDGKTIRLENVNES